MTSTQFDLSSLLEPLGKHTLILTPNNRLKRKILQAWGEHCEAQGLKYWSSPNVHALADWQMECWAQLQDRAHRDCDHNIASDALRKFAWQQAIQTSAHGGGLYKTEVLAANADSAWRNLGLWQVTQNQLDEFLNPELEHFLGWLKQVEGTLKLHGLITRECSFEKVRVAFLEGGLAQQEAILLHGFDDLPPLHRSLCEAACKTLIENPKLQRPLGRLSRTSALNESAEILAAALWSRDILSQDPKARIGIIVPKLGQSRDEVERLFTEVFEAGAVLPSEARYTLPFNFSAGTPLGSTALIHDTLKLLSLQQKQWPLEEICSLLQSPFWDAGSDHFRTRVCRELRRLGQLTISASDLKESCTFLTERASDQLHLGDESELRARLQEISDQQRGRARQQSAGQWAQQFQAQLTLCGWPGARRLDSNEYQQATLWFQLLEDFSELSLLGANMSASEAMKTLAQLANNTHFQAQTPDSPIQILGVLEGAGLQFSHCWVMGLNRKVWPPAPSPNPLLPIDLQRQFQMPHASVERELQFAESLTEGYRSAAAEVVFSSASQDEESAQYPSALITDIEATPLAQLLNSTESNLEVYCRKLAEETQLDALDCARAPALNLEEKKSISGGSGIIQQQANCPFNAFAIYRLKARDFDAPSPGLSPMERGIILHHALQIFWEGTQNSVNLTALTEDELAAKVQHCIEQALHPWRKRRSRQCGPRYFELEQTRLFRLLQPWMQQEKSRPPFEQVASEQEMSIDLAGLPLKMRLDRVDTLPDGRLLLIDYKTGETNIKSWSGEKPKEPQLPLYALSLNNQCAGIAFAQINAKGSMFKGIGELTEAVDGILAPAKIRNSDLPDNWVEMGEHWESVLTELSQEFQQGLSRVHYKDNNAMNYSEHLFPLNRFPERARIEKALMEKSSREPVQGDWLND
jgi:probable DNA repair protein